MIYEPHTETQRQRGASAFGVAESQAEVSASSFKLFSWPLLEREAFFQFVSK